MPLTQVLLDHLGWRGTLEALAAINLVLCVPLHLLVLDSSKDAPKAPATKAADGTDNAIVRWAFRQTAFWALAITFTVYYATFTALSFHMYPLLAERGLDATHIVAAMACIGPAQVAGRIVVAILLKRAPIATVGLWTTLLLPPTLLSLALLGESFLPLTAFAVAYGALNGIMTIVRGAAVPEMLTRHAYGAVNGVLTLPTALLRAAAPSLAALLWQATGSYAAVLVAVIFATLVVSVSFVMAVRNPPRGDLS